MDFPVPLDPAADSILETLEIHEIIEIIEKVAADQPVVSGV